MVYYKNLPRNQWIKITMKIVTNCKKHGEIYEENAKKVIRGKWSGYRCNLCVRHQKTKSYFISSNYKCKKEKKLDDISQSYLKRKYNLSLEKYMEILTKQNNCCAICKKPESAVSSFNNKIKKLAVDHCHKSNKVRGLLCQSCNTSLGAFDDSIDLLKSAIIYLMTNQ